jgi:23S rRNA maturation-related 3'-5' exoribonuclease YhaM
VKEKIIELLRSTGRDGIENLITYMEEAEFFTAPCSASHHLNKVGGLAEHSLNVYEFGSRLINNIPDGMPCDSWRIVSLLHDLGKSTYRGRPTYELNYLASGKVSEKKPYEVNKESYFNHELKSILIAKQFIELTDDEEFAIYYHNGLYEMSGREIQGKERPLQQLLHFADMWCSRFIETKEGAE